MPQVSNNNDSSDRHQISDIFEDMNIMYYMQIATNLKVKALAVAASGLQFARGCHVF